MAVFKNFISKAENSPLKPLVRATNFFFFETPTQTSYAPFIRDGVDMKRWMMLVLYALLPCIFMALWNSGLYSFVYTSGNKVLLKEYLESAGSFSSYFHFVFTEGRWLSILREGAYLFLPIVTVSYAAGGLCEVIFAIIRKKEISEGFLVTGILFALILPPTIPLWMVALGVSFGVIFAKELFGGSGMNFMNPALAGRVFLFLAFPGRMSGNVWMGRSTQALQNSLRKMGGEFDGYTAASQLALAKVPSDIKRIHVDAIASTHLGTHVPTHDALQFHFQKWNAASGLHASSMSQLSPQEMMHFVTSPTSIGGLGLAPSSYEDAAHFADLQYGHCPHGDWSCFFGDKVGSLGETSLFAILLGALFLILTGVASWRTMVAMGLGAYLTALLFEWGSRLIEEEGGAWNSAGFSLPAHKHLLFGGLAFGAVFMVTDPVTSPVLKGAKWVYGFLCGFLTILIRVVNPAYAEGVMFAILIGNVFAPMIDNIALERVIKKRRARVAVRAA